MIFNFPNHNSVKLVHWVSPSPEPTRRRPPQQGWCQIEYRRISGSLGRAMAASTLVIIEGLGPPPPGRVLVKCRNHLSLRGLGSCVTWKQHFRNGFSFDLVNDQFWTVVSFSLVFLRRRRTRLHNLM